MKKLFQILVGFIFSFVFSIAVLAKSGPAIPLPQVSVTEAIALAQNYFYNKENRMVDADFFKKKDYVLCLVRYTNQFNGKFEDEWAWEVKFIHPVQNDHSVAYKVTQERKIIFLYASE